MPAVRSYIVRSYDMDVARLAAFGFVWVRPHVVEWKKSLRNPTIGSLLEFTDREIVGAVPIYSCAARELFTRLAVRG
jgi:hypothetical protein